MNLVEEAQAQYDRRAQGGAKASTELLAALAGPRGTGRAEALWRLALLSQERLNGEKVSVDSAAGRALDLSQLDGQARVAACHAFEGLGRLAVLSFSTVELLDWSDRLAATDSESSRLEVGVLNAWMAYLAPGQAADPDLEELLRQAMAARDAALTVELEALRALVALSKGEVGEAVKLARRASRMGRTEGILHPEILANVALARVRRHQNLPHLSIRILTALLPHAPAVWRPWIHWELRMAGSFAPLASESGAAARLRQFLGAVDAGNDEGAVRLGQALVEQATAAPLREDAEHAAALLLYPKAPVDLPSLNAWRWGEHAELPSGLVGIAFAAGELGSTHAASARVIAPQEGRGYRVPPLALRFAMSVTGAQADADDKPQPRADAGLSLLALSGSTIPREIYFKTLYEFDYDSSVHGAMFSMHLNRIRSRLGDAGEVVSDDEGLRLVMKQTAILTDPRCAELLPQRALRVLSQTPEGISAKDLARELAVPLRNAQRVLKELVGDGALKTEQKGRAVVYEVEDTTFSEPTQSRVFESAETV